MTRSPLLGGAAAALVFFGFGPLAIGQSVAGPNPGPASPEAASAAPQQTIARKWPGDSIAKVREEEFWRFAAGRPAADRAALLDAFLDEQWAWFGAERPEGVLSFVSPSHAVELPSTSASLAPVPEGPEPNTDPNGPFMGTPTPIACSDLGAGSVFPVVDSDWWSVTQPAGGRFVASVGPGSAGSITDPVLTLRDAAGAVLMVSDDAPGRGRFSLIDIDLTAGDYFLEVTGFGNVRTGTYSLDVICGAPAAVDPSSANVFEVPGPNDSVATATPSDCDDVCAGVIDSPTDSDWFAFEVTTSGALVGLTSAGRGSTPIADTVLTLRDATGTVLATIDDFGASDFAILFTFAAPGQYFWEVTGGAGATGSYQLATTCSGGASAEPEAPEPNDSAATSAPLVCGDVGSGTIASASDADWWRVTTLRRGNLTLRTSLPTGSTFSDSRLTLRDESGLVLAVDDDSGPGQLSVIAQTLFAGDYFVVVEGANGSTGDYRLDVDCGSPTALGGAQFTVDPGGCSGTAGLPTIVPRQFQEPVLGSTFPLDVENLIPGGSAALNFGISDLVGPGGAALPLDLGPLGAAGCVLTVSSEFAIPLLVDAAGRASHAFRIPNSVAFGGLELFFQPIVADPAANPLGLVTGTTAMVVVGPLQ